METKIRHIIFVAYSRAHRLTVTVSQYLFMIPRVQRPVRVATSSSSSIPRKNATAADILYLEFDGHVPVGGR